MFKQLTDKQLLSFKNISVIAEFELRAYFEQTSNIFSQLLLEPICYIVLFTKGLAGILDNQIIYKETLVSYVSFVYPGILGLQIYRMFSHSIYRQTIETRWGLQALKLSTGTGCLGYGLGTLLLPITICCLKSMVCFLAFISIGGALSMILFLKLTLIGCVCAFFWHALAFFISGLFRSYAKRDMFINFLFLPINLTAPVFYSLDKAPSYIKFIASINPLAHQVQLLRSIVLESTINYRLLCGHLLIGLGLFSFGLYRLKTKDVNFSQV